eukprot:667795-Rhodomonas_salina.1
MRCEAMRCAETGEEVRRELRRDAKRRVSNSAVVYKREREGERASWPGQTWATHDAQQTWATHDAQQTWYMENIDCWKSANSSARSP